MTMQQHGHIFAQSLPLSETQVLNNTLVYSMPKNVFFKLNRAKNANALLAALLANHFESPSFTCMLRVKAMPTMVPAALYRRAVAEAYLNICASYGVSLTLNVDELQMLIAENVEVYFIAKHDLNIGMKTACFIMADMVLPDFMNDFPHFTLSRETLMDELCREYTKAANTAVTLH